MAYNLEEQKARARERSRNWALANPEKVKYSQKKWAASDKVKVKRRRDRWETRNRDKVRAARSAYKKAHPAIYAAAQSKRRLRVKQQCPIWTNSEKIQAIYAEAVRLTAETGIKHHVDHEIPLRGRLISGLHVDTNLRAIPATVNMRKYNKFEVSHAT